MPRWTTLLLIGCLLEATALCGIASAQAGGAIGPAAARDLPRGAVLERDDIARDTAGVTADNDVVGWVTRRVVNKGEALRAPAIAPPQLVRSGDPVQLVYRQGSLEIRIAGNAMNSATEGERVLVRIDTKRRFEGIAEAPGVVRLVSHETSR